MEKAIFITRIENLRYLENEDCQRIYFGIEFCERLIPPVEDVDKVIRLARAQKLGFTLVTPYVTEPGLEKLREIFEHLVKGAVKCEVVFNDWGVFNLLTRYPDLEPVLGRLLTKQKRGPRLLNVQSHVPRTMLEHFRHTNTDLPIYQEFLRKKGVTRIELDNTVQGIRKHSDFQASLYHPYVYISTTRMCLTNSCDRENRKPMRAIFPCGFECRKYTFQLEHKDMPRKILLKGNTQFYENHSIPGELENLNVDRLVYMPEIPI